MAQLTAKKMHSNPKIAHHLLFVTLDADMSSKLELLVLNSSTL